MADITASMVKDLRERTGLGMMECKKALVEAGGDIDLAVENLRKSGAAKADKKAGRTAAQGAVVIASEGNYGLMLEVNSETDFVARDENFLKFCREVAEAAKSAKATEVDAIKALSVSNGSVEESRQALVQKIGENIQVRRAIALQAEGVIGGYIHGGRIGVLVALKGGDEELAKDVAMHVAAVNPMVLNAEDVPAEVLEKEKEIIRAQPDMAGKPEDIVEKMLVGRINKFLKEVSLVEQPFVKDPNTTVGKLVKSAGAEITAFARFEVGEGIEVEQVDFAAEVAAQVKGAK
ncbi:MAG: elongation factor Ts [Pseudomonadales bacterium]|nr:elongation factor Ts [Pseudomonadales bacterium]